MRGEMCLPTNTLKEKNYKALNFLTEHGTLIKKKKKQLVISVDLNGSRTVLITNAAFRMFSNNEMSYLKFLHVVQGSCILQSHFSKSSVLSFRVKVQLFLSQLSFSSSLSSLRTVWLHFRSAFIL